MEMKKYKVTLHYNTYVTVEVGALSVDEALVHAYIEAGKEKYDAQVLRNIHIVDECEPDVEEIGKILY